MGKKNWLFKLMSRRKTEKTLDVLVLKRENTIFLIFSRLPVLVNHNELLLIEGPALFFPLGKGLHEFLHF